MDSLQCFLRTHQPSKATPALEITATGRLRRFRVRRDNIIDVDGNLYRPILTGFVESALSLELGFLCRVM
jgi:hypothetical protein